MPAWSEFLKKCSASLSMIRREEAPRFVSGFESLEPRLLLSVSAVFVPQVGLLTALGDGQDDTIEISRDAAGNILVNDGAVTIAGGTPTVANTSLIELFGRDGSDTLEFDETNGALPRANMFGGAGADSLRSGSGADMLFGQAGDDFADGNRGNDQAFLDAGDDVFQWDPGDGSDVVEGQAGTDTLLFNGSGADETFDVSANGERVRFFRDVGNIVMDLDDVEDIDLNALGGADTVTVNDVSGTDLANVDVNLAGVLGGTGGDGQPDNVIVNATNGDDVVVVAGDATGVSVIGLAAEVNITDSEAANDTLTVSALAGDDVVDASALAAGAIQLTADGGAGSDVLIGSAGDDVLGGGDGDDVLIGGLGQDVIDGGLGDDIEIA
jgi:Ca2+-binding RTX toxin-like protein